MKNLKYILIALVVIGGGAGVYFGGLLGSHEAEAEVPVDSHGNPIATAKGGDIPLYLSMTPAFVVNFTHRGALHYLQIEMDMMYHDQHILDEIVENMPAIRNDLILLFSNQEFEKLITAEGKEELRAEIVKTVNHVVEVEPDHETGETDGEVYFTHFVMQ